MLGFRLQTANIIFIVINDFISNHLILSDQKIMAFVSKISCIYISPEGVQDESNELKPVELCPNVCLA